MGNIDLAKSVADTCSNLTEDDNNSEQDYWISGSDSTQAFAYSAIKGAYAHFVSNQNGNIISRPTNRNRTGLWVDSVCHISDMSVECNGKSSKTDFKSHVRSFGYIYRNFKDYERIDYIPEKKSGISFIFIPKCDGKITVSFRISHLRAWPSVSSGKGFSVNETSNGLVVKSSVSETSISVTRGAKIGLQKDSSGVSLRIEIMKASEIYVSGDNSILEDNELESTILFHSSIKDHTTLKTPDFKINKLFLWTRHDLLELFSHSSIGSGFYAGLPGFSWFFGRDGEWMSLAATEAGLHDLSRQHLDLLWKYSRNGRIPHELPLYSDDSDYGFDINGDIVRTRFLSIDSAPLWVLNEIHLSNWSGNKIDSERVNEVLNFIRSCDRDGDGLVENRFDEGLIGWVEDWAKDRDGACVDVNALCIQAEKMLERCSRKGEDKWESSIERYISKFMEKNGEKTTIWDSSDGSNRKEVKTPMSLMPFSFFPVELKEYSPGILSEYSKEDMLVPWGVRSLSSEDRMYDDGYHTGMVWPLMTGWSALSFFSCGEVDRGMELLNSFVTLAYSSPSKGRIGEVYSSSDMRETGQFFQGWSSALFISTVMEGLMGITLDSMCYEDWENHITPHLPEQWGEVELLNVRKGEDMVDIRMDSTGVSVSESDSVVKYGKHGRK